MRSLDEFHKYIEKQEQVLREKATVTPLERAAAPVAKPPASEPETTAPVAAAPAPLAQRVSRYERILPREALELEPGEPRSGGQVPNLPQMPPGTRYVMRGGMTMPVEPPASKLEMPDIESYIPGLREPAPRTEPPKPAAEPPPSPVPLEAADYLPPIVEDEEPTQVADAPARPRTRRLAPAAGPSISDQEAAALWGRLPRHIQLLVGMSEPQEEVAQKYYTRGFKESRHQLIERLLDPTLTLEDTARVLGVCPTTVRRYTNRGILPHHRTVGQQRRFRLSDVLAFLEQQGHKTAGESGEQDDD